jgi:hypothetical protein
MWSCPNGEPPTFFQFDVQVDKKLEPRNGVSLVVLQSDGLQDLYWNSQTQVWIPSLILHHYSQNDILCVGFAICWASYQKSSLRALTKEYK